MKGLLCKSQWDLLMTFSTVEIKNNELFNEKYFFLTLKQLQDHLQHLYFNNRIKIRNAQHQMVMNEEKKVSRIVDQQKK